MVPQISGKGTVDLVVPALPLLPGTYDLSASITDAAAAHVYDSRRRTLRFDVEAGTPRESFGGVLSLRGEWEHRADEPTSSGPA